MRILKSLTLGACALTIAACANFNDPAVRAAIEADRLSGCEHLTSIERHSCLDIARDIAARQARAG